MAFKLTKGNVDDRKPVPDLVCGLTGKLVGDKGYISKNLFFQLWEEGLQLVTKIKKNMKLDRIFRLIFSRSIALG